MYLYHHHGLYQIPGDDLHGHFLSIACYVNSSISQKNSDNISKKKWVSNDGKCCSKDTRTKISLQCRTPVLLHHIISKSIHQ